MLKRWACLAVGVIVLLLLSGTYSGAPDVAPAVVAVTPTSAGGQVSSAITSNGVATLTIASPSQALPLPPGFWGADVVASYPFGSGAAAKINATPVTYLRYPGGVLGEELNYTSNVITATSGKVSVANTSVRAFIRSCLTIDCHAILQLPAEINDSYTAAYYASYVVNTLHFQPAYWEIGNSVPGWTHFGVPWVGWTTPTKTNATPLQFAQLVDTYITAVRSVDPSALFIALGAAMGAPGYDQTWITDLTLIDGHTLSGISVHSYTMGTSPPFPTWPELLANLNGKYSLPDQVTADRGYILTTCANCALQLFVTEANVAEVDSYATLDSTFAGALYVAADTAQALDLRLTNLDWYCYECNFSGSWKNSSTQQFGLQYTLLSKMMPMLGKETLATNVTGLSTFYAAATYGPSGYALLLVNSNMTQTASFSLSHTGISPGSTAVRERWSNGSGKPNHATITLGKTVDVPALTIEILLV
jgi:hypothetical protein